jgi:hypothetical protein
MDLEATEKALSQMGHRVGGGLAKIKWQIKMENGK